MARTFPAKDQNHPAYWAVKWAKLEEEATGVPVADRRRTMAVLKLIGQVMDHQRERDAQVLESQILPEEERQKITDPNVRLMANTAAQILQQAADRLRTGK